MTLLYIIRKMSTIIQTSEECKVLVKWKVSNITFDLLNYYYNQVNKLQLNYKILTQKFNML